MMDKTLILRKMEELEKCLGGLEAMRGYDIKTFKRDVEKQWAAERGLQIAVQIILDAGAHILASSGETGIEDYGEVIERLGKKGVVPKSFADSIKGMAGFRNILVHEYADVDLGLVYGVLQKRLSDFRRYIKYILRHVERA